MKAVWSPNRLPTPDHRCCGKQQWLNDSLPLLENGKSYGLSNRRFVLLRVRRPLPELHRRHGQPAYRAASVTERWL